MKSSEWGEKELVWGSKQVKQYNICKGKESGVREKLFHNV